MLELIEANWPLVVVAVLAVLLLAWYLFHASRKTSVSRDTSDVLDEGAAPAARNQALIDSTPSDLTRIKGVGPKLAKLLGEMGVASFAQIAAWDAAEIAKIDAQLGRFQGRIERDNWTEQARFLAAGDTDGYSAKFGAID